LGPKKNRRCPRARRPKKGGGPRGPRGRPPVFSGENLGFLPRVRGGGGGTRWGGTGRGFGEKSLSVRAGKTPAQAALGRNPPGRRPGISARGGGGDGPRKGGGPGGPPRRGGGGGPPPRGPGPRRRNKGGAAKNFLAGRGRCSRGAGAGHPPLQGPRGRKGLVTKQRGRFSPGALFKPGLPAGGGGEPGPGFQKGGGATFSPKNEPPHFVFPGSAAGVEGKCFLFSRNPGGPIVFPAQLSVVRPGGGRVFLFGGGGTPKNPFFTLLGGGRGIFPFKSLGGAPPAGKKKKKKKNPTFGRKKKKPRARGIFFVQRDVCGPPLWARGVGGGGGGETLNLGFKGGRGVFYVCGLGGESDCFGKRGGSGEGFGPYCTGPTSPPSQGPKPGGRGNPPRWARGFGFFRGGGPAPPPPGIRRCLSKGGGLLGTVRGGGDAGEHGKRLFFSFFDPPVAHRGCFFLPVAGAGAHLGFPGNRRFEGGGGARPGKARRAKKKNKKAKKKPRSRRPRAPPTGKKKKEIFCLGRFLFFFFVPIRGGAPQGGHKKHPPTLFPPPKNFFFPGLPGGPPPPTAGGTLCLGLGKTGGAFGPFFGFPRRARFVFFFFWIRLKTFRWGAIPGPDSVAPRGSSGGCGPNPQPKPGNTAGDPPAGFAHPAA